MAFKFFITNRLKICNFICLIFIMAYSSLQQCIDDLEKSGQLIRIKEEVDPYLEMAAIHLRIHEAKGKAILYEISKAANTKRYPIYLVPQPAVSLFLETPYKTYRN